ncbi:phytanoyl-CoA dioxygenase family protein [Pseudomonas sp. B21-054]|uniref:phytanoyl-CoA dioxygenase family protein n=1 Tax=Pseudomonas sp. B21-054 TaxID=2895494 RepID=UPI002230468A|nr:phytanoyl-CoA dioxygenase family protein [Pseudomonas sp. B21-054]UZE19617.1 phytanoyl-CoA dioxygenase family protein [Pseudomonas sp. B21-054]
MLNHIPTSSYGILQRTISESAIDLAAEQISSLGYATIPSGIGIEELNRFQIDFDSNRDQYIKTFGLDKLTYTDELNIIRAPLTHGPESFLKIATNKILLSLISKLIQGDFILNQQNSIINPPKKQYNQGAWHRDLPYQHFTSSSPIAVNAIFCVDDFTERNGGTFVLPASHKSTKFPSPEYISKNAIQIEAKAGDYIVLDCMIFHAGGFNSTSIARRGVNHVYTIPFLKQQIRLPDNIDTSGLSEDIKKLLGFGYSEPKTISEFLDSRPRT